MLLGTIIYYVPSGWSLFFKCIPSFPTFIYRPNFLASLAFMISLPCAGLVQVAIEHQPR